MFNLTKKFIGETSDAMVLFDIGGTKIRVAVSHDGRTFKEPKIAPTPKDFNQGMSVFKKLADDALGGSQVKIVAGGVPGVLNRGRSTIFKLPNLPEWDGKPIKRELEKMFGASVYIENDSALVGLGEATKGAGKAYNIVAYVTVSTGIGGARIVGRKIDQRAIGFEPGWQIVNQADLGKDTNSAYLGYYISGNYLEKRLGKKIKDIENEVLHENMSAYLASGLYNSILHWSPDVVILGGSMITGVNPIPLDIVEDKLRKLLTIFPEIPEIKKASLGDFGGIYGALELIRDVE